MRFSIITPCFRGSNWLRLCVASVADQAIEHEHIVQDSCSDDGTQDWLPRDPRVKAFIEKDQGMYDAVNRGMRRASGEILAYLNCDEQYLPGALRSVSAFFDLHPEIDVVFADAVVVDESGGYCCDRMSLIPQRWHTLVSANLSFLTCATFFRRRLISELGMFFDPGLRVCGDAEWAFRLINKGVGFAVLRQRTSVFAETGGNLSLDPQTAREQAILAKCAPMLARRLRTLVVLHYRLRRWRAGAYSPKPHSYSIFTHASPQTRRLFQVDKPAFLWNRKAESAQV